MQKTLDWDAPDAIDTALDTFIGYLLLDAWIGNGDRHHENWGFIETIDRGTYLSPTYDHACCLGRELLDEKRQERLQSKTVQAYTDRSRSAFYAHVFDNKPLTTLATFQKAANASPKAASVWLSRLRNVTDATTLACLHRISSQRISTTAVSFAQQVLIISKGKLLSSSSENLS